MKHVKLSVISLILSVVTIVLYGMGYSGVFLFVPTLVAFLMAIKAYTINASAHITVAASMFAVGINSALVFMFTDNLLAPLAYILICGVGNFKMRIAKFNYTSLLFVEPLVSLIGLAMLIYGGVKTNFTWDLWVFASLPAYGYAIVNFMNYVDRSRIKAASKVYTAVGERAQDFALANEDNETISLSQYRGKVVLLIFVRGDWCPGCHIMLRTYERNREAIQAAGVTLLCVGPDPVGVNKEMATKIGVKYHILSDPGQEVAMRYTIELQQPMPSTPKDYKGVPLPAAFLIDKEGVIRHTSSAEKAGEILNPQLLIDTLKELN